MSEPSSASSLSPRWDGIASTTFHRFCLPSQLPIPQLTPLKVAPPPPAVQNEECPALVRVAAATTVEPTLHACPGESVTKATEKAASRCRFMTKFDTTLDPVQLLNITSFRKMDLNCPLLIVVLFFVDYRRNHV